ncbi:MAG: nitrilase-related carbon-nitrogen hydrolase [Pigmentiphaga sp.]
MAVETHTISPFKAAAVQAAPIWFDLNATIDKSIRLMEQAADQGVRILAFPETWLPGYPVFIWMKDFSWQAPHRGAYHEASLELGSEQHRKLEAAVKRTGVMCLLGLSERQGDRIYMAQMLIDPINGTIMTRRKIKPSGLEGTFFSTGDADNLKVVPTPLGNIGALNCSEHRRPLLRHVMSNQNEQLHVASWPSFGLNADSTTVRGLWNGLERRPVYGVRPDVISMRPDACMTTTRAYAREGGLYVLAPTIVIDDTLRSGWAREDGLVDQLALGGGATHIFNPMGEDAVTPLAHDEEGLLIATVDYSLLRDVHDADPLFEKISAAEYHRVFFP